ncbi:hypothetical protein K7X08_010290 [Anisodus acutangulus]|uniref:Uncharacterized protein n=1 Tax=Anisodus acutangulus TaxID=402998 RepID=A0A9Q1N124_9SOLA|nr:hypothetical protein K7X08_010290 [Anisodus acutangulus]
MNPMAWKIVLVAPTVGDYKQDGDDVAPHENWYMDVLAYPTGNVHHSNEEISFMKALAIKLCGTMSSLSSSRMDLKTCSEDIVPHNLMLISWSQVGGLIQFSM